MVEFGDLVEVSSYKCGLQKKNRLTKQIYQTKKKKKKKKKKQTKQTKQTKDKF
jgi:hypothetical protein